MQRKVPRYYTTVVFLAAYVLTYTLALITQPPLPRYFPTEHVWRWAATPGVPSMGWYGLMALTLLVSGLITLAAHLLFKQMASDQKHVAAHTQRIVAWSITAVFILALAYIAVHELYRWGVLMG